MGRRRWPAAAAATGAPWPETATARADVGLRPYCARAVAAVASPASGGREGEKKREEAERGGGGGNAGAAGGLPRRRGFGRGGGGGGAASGETERARVFFSEARG